MAAKASNKDIMLNRVYSLGAAIVIIGALMKINHWSIGPISGTWVLAIGLIVEAIIFVIFAFDPPPGEYEWEKVYPELAEGTKATKSAVKELKKIEETEVSLSQRLDKLMADAKIDSSLFDRLRSGIDNFKSSVDNINTEATSLGSTQKYADQVSLAANHMESLNTLYLQQLEEGEKALKYNKQMMEEMQKSSEKSTEFSIQMENLTKNLANLNNVYGSMLSAMKGGNA